MNGRWLYTSYIGPRKYASPTSTGPSLFGSQGRRRPFEVLFLVRRWVFFFFAETAEDVNWHGRRRNPIFSLSSWVSALRINMLDSQMYTFIIMYSYFLFLAFFTWTWTSVPPSLPSISRPCFLSLTCACSTLMLMVGLEPSMRISIFVDVVSWNDFIGQHHDNCNKFTLTLLPIDNTMSVLITSEIFPSLLTWVWQAASANREFSSCISFLEKRLTFVVRRVLVDIVAG